LKTSQKFSMPKNKTAPCRLWLCLVFAVAASAVLSVCLGSVLLPPSAIFSVLFGGEKGTAAANILLYVRLLRTFGSLLAGSALGGAALLTFCDVAARTLFAPYELPVGIVMSLTGAPFFIWLLLHQRGGRTHD
jgi:ABC-type Fe3+-siderophore transport system permease subunit